MPSETQESEPMPLTPDGDLRELRGLLFGPELGRLEAIEHRLADPALRSQDVSTVIAEAISIRAKTDHKLQTALQPLVEESLRISVARDPAMLATALFPIIGEAVRKAVAHALQGMFDSLNLMLNRGLSLESWKWRFEAWRTGKTFGQVALTRSLTYRVEQVFLIHRKTGLLVGHVAYEESLLRDADLIAGMLTALQDFWYDSFEPKKAGELEVIQVGEYKVWLQYGPVALLAAMVSGQAPPELREVFERELEAIHRDYGVALESFEGDASTVAGAEENLRRCLLGAQQKVVTHKSRAPLWLAFCALLLAIATLTGLRVRDNLRWAQYLDRLRTQPGIVVVDSRRSWRGYAVNGLRDPLAIDPEPLLDEFHVPKNKVTERWEPYLSLDPAFALARRLETEKALVERQVIRFDLNSAELPLSQFDTLDAAAEGISALRKTALANHQRIAIRIEGHTDQTGKEDRNLQLSAARAQMVAKLLLRRGVTPEMLNAQGLGGSRPEHAGDESYPLELDRRVTFQVFLLPLENGSGAEK